MNEIKNINALGSNLQALAAEFGATEIVHLAGPIFLAVRRNGN